MTKSRKPKKRPIVHALVDKINACDESERNHLAKQCNTTIGNLRQIAYGHGGCSVILAKSISEACDDVSIADLLPELNGLTSANDASFQQDLA